MRTKILILGLICFFVFIYCKKQLPTSPDLRSAVINYFKANPEEIRWGESSTLSWSTDGALRLVIDNDIGEVVYPSGTRVVFPRVFTTYMLTAYGEANTVSRIATVNVLHYDDPMDDNK